MIFIASTYASLYCISTTEKSTCMVVTDEKHVNGDNNNINNDNNNKKNNDNNNDNNNYNK